MTTGTGVVSCTDAVNSGAETYCTGLETANTGSVFGSEASSREAVAVELLIWQPGARLHGGSFTPSGIGHSATQQLEKLMNVNSKRVPW